MEEKKLGIRPYISCEKDAIDILKYGTETEKSSLAIAMGFDYPESGFAQSVCLRLSESENAGIRANAIIGFTHIARRFKVLDKRVVKPIILRELRENKKYRELIIDAVRDLNIYLNWNLGAKFLKKIDDKMIE